MKYDPGQSKQVMLFLQRFAAGAQTFGNAMQAAGQNVMKFGCSLMLLGLIGLVLFAVIF